MRYSYRNAVLEALKKRWPGMKHLFADGAYNRRALMDKAATLDFVARGGAPPRGSGWLRGAAPALGGGTHLRLDDSLALSRLAVCCTTFIPGLPALRSVLFLRAAR